MLLGEDMLDIATNERIHLAVSIDGLKRCHDLHLRTAQPAEALSISLKGASPHSCGDSLTPRRS